jgi:hypothetical protein
MPISKLRTALLTCLLLALGATSAQAYAPFQMGLHDPVADNGDAARFDLARDAHARIARITVYWADHVPAGSDPPAGFDARNPADPGYNWTAIDAFVRAAGERGIDPLITTLKAPTWAEGDDAADRAQRTGDPGTYHPNAKAYGDFMHALATRYSGKFPDPANPGRNLPRVSYFQIWNEPNFGQYLFDRQKAKIPIYYVRLLNAGYDAVKAVSKTNLVLTAGLGPYGNNGHATDVDPQFFMREVLCLTGRGGSNLGTVRGCHVPKPKFDVWAQHPYTLAGTPRSSGQSPDAAALGNMPAVKRTLDYASRVGHVLPRGHKKLWASEFGWFSNPPGITSGGTQLGKPPAVQAAYLSESAYRLWKTGFSAFVWYGLDDQEGFPTGLYLGHLPDAGAKPALDAFRFPFYAERRGSRVLVWGLASGSHTSRVQIEKKSGSTWKKVTSFRTDGQGMLYRAVKGGRGTYRAEMLSGTRKGLASLGYAAR